jgi:DNA-binding MarR family transcriptional regulator
VRVVVGSEETDPTLGLNPGVATLRYSAWRSFVEAHGTVLWLMRKELTDATGVPAVWYEVLAYANQAPDRRVELSALEDVLVFSQSGVSQLVTRIEAAGLVRRLPHSRDGRRTIVELTGEGAEVLGRCADVHRRSIDEHFGALVSDDEATVIAAALGRVRDHARASRSAGRHVAPPRSAATEQ